VDTVRDRAWALLDGTRWTLEAWFNEANALITDLKTETAPGKKADPSSDEGKAWLALQPALEHMLANGDASHTRAWVEEVCVAWWETMTAAQLAQGLSPKKSYRAMAAYILGRHKHAQGDIGGAARWTSLAYLSDVLSGHPGSGGAEVVLKFGLGVPEDTVKGLKVLATKVTPTAPSTWKDVETFPELLLTQALTSDWGRFLVAPTIVPSHHTCRPFLRAATKWALDATGLNTNQQGKRLELLASYLASALPGARPMRGFNAPGGACEYDVVAAQIGANTYSFPGEATSLLMECKNWDHPARSAEVGYFLARIKYAGAGLGIMMCKEAITGWKAKEPRHARLLLEGFCQREHLACVVITGDDLRDLANTGSFAALLEDRYRLTTLGKVKKG
jgi:hypothetical protein